MTSPADIYDQALERLSATNLSDEVEDINLGGTMLQAANESMPNPLGRQVSGTTFDGGRHAKSSLDSIEQHVTPRRRQQEPASTAVAPCISESGLTRQATNNTRVTARRDGQSFRQIEAEANEEVRRIVRGQPEYTRTPEHDTRISRGDICDANAWRDAKGATRMFCLGYDAAARRWMALDDVQGRAAINGETQ